MVFSSFLFLFLFLPVALGSYFLTPARWKNLTLLLWSYAFYAWGAPGLVGVFFFSCAVDYLLGILIGASAQAGRRKFLLLCSIVLNVGALLYFKYFNFFIAQANQALVSAGFHQIQWTAVALPIGISFFTFHKLSYIIDVYRGVVAPAKNFIDFSLYIALFPQLIAGPIIRYHDINEQLTARRHTMDDVFEGGFRFCVGLAKKVLIADVMGEVADHVFQLSPNQLSTAYAWLGIVAYAYQIYFDFSGYSDMAIGLGRIMGFHFLENFDRPYISQNFTEFWRRWHISLSRWMRDYLYIPLGGNRASVARRYLNLWIVFFISGLWHGANWTFIVWGLYQGFFLVLDKLFWLDFSKRIGRFANTLLTFVLVLFGWVLFRSDTIGGALSYIRRMLDAFNYGVMPQAVLRGSIIQNEGIFILIIASLICFLPSWPALMSRIASFAQNLEFRETLALKFAACVSCLVLTALALSTTQYSPFIYFRF